MTNYAEADHHFEADKSTWGDGPWQREPDRYEFRYKNTPCLAHRNHIGTWCGYAAVAPGHPYHGVDYDSIRDLEKQFKIQDDKCIDVHGGLTYSGLCAGNVCHVPLEGEPDNVWWLGFDAAHGNDISPAMIALQHRAAPDLLGRQQYRDLPYIVNEIEGLVDSLEHARLIKA